MDNDTLISTASLFHYTKREYLIKIIEEGFKPRISWESFDIEKSETTETLKRAFGYAPSSDTSFCLGIPMICFCDIPLNVVKTHCNVYGEYGIALTKEWLVRQTGVSPVIYVNHGSEFLSNFKTLYQKANQEGGELMKPAVYSILRLIKSYNGYFKKDGYENENHKFYDEREWRYVPPYYLCKPYLTTDEKHLTDDFNSKVSYIDFSADEIKAVVVKEANDIEYFYKVLMDKFKTFDKKKIVTK